MSDKRKVNSLCKALLAVILMLGSGTAWAEIPDYKAVEAILGEAGPSYAERLAIASVLRQRGTLKGVYGHRKPASDRERREAIRIWNESKTPPRALKGATHWLSDYDLRHCRPAMTKFRFKMQEVAYVGTTHFYKEIR